MTWWGWEAGQSVREELMDAPGVEEHELHRVYEELRIINRWLGGHSSSLDGLRRLVPEGPVSVLDVGFGGGDFAEVLAAWSRRTGRPVRYLGIESSPVAVSYARERFSGESFRFERADLFEAAERMDAEHDVVHMSLTLHHFPGASAVQAVRAMARLARVGVLVNDLQRHFVPYAAIKGLTAVFSRSRLVKNDAPLSVNRGFLRGELASICARAGVDAEIRWRPMFRWLLLARPRED